MPDCKNIIYSKPTRTLFESLWKQNPVNIWDLKDMKFEVLET